MRLSLFFCFTAYDKKPFSFKRASRGFLSFEKYGIVSEKSDYAVFLFETECSL